MGLCGALSKFDDSFSVYRGYCSAGHAPYAKPKPAFLWVQDVMAALRGTGINPFPNWLRQFNLSPGEMLRVGRCTVSGEWVFTVPRKV
jgi:hypothetical protein